MSRVLQTLTPMLHHDVTFFFCESFSHPPPPKSWSTVNRISHSFRRMVWVPVERVLVLCDQRRKKVLGCECVFDVIADIVRVILRDYELWCLFLNVRCAVSVFLFLQSGCVSNPVCGLTVFCCNREISQARKSNDVRLAQRLSVLSPFLCVCSPPGTIHGRILLITTDAGPNV